MPLEPQAVSVPLLAMNQKAPTSSGPVGRLSKLTNGIVQKIRGAGATATAVATEQIRVQKRSGLTKLTTNVSDVDQGGTGAGGITNAQLVSSLNGNLFEVSDNMQPFVYDRQVPVWASWSNHPLINTLSREPIYTADAQIAAPDYATAGNVRCYVWTPVGGAPTVKFEDSNGVVLREPVTLGTPNTPFRVKVVADATRFWVFFDVTGHNVRVNVYSTLGLQIDTANVDTLVNAGDTWDVVYDSSVGVCFARSLSPVGARLSVLSYSSGVVISANSNTSIPWSNNNTGGTTGQDYGGAFLTSYEADGHVYLFSIFDTDGAILHVSQLTANATITHDYTWADASVFVPNIVCNATGYVKPGSQDIVVTYSQTPTTIPMNFKTTTVTVAFGGTVGTLVHERSVQIASRAFRQGKRFYVYAYYASVTGPAANQFSQTTFFLLDVTADVLSAGVVQVAGRLEYGQAAMDWVFTGWDGTLNIGPGFFRLPSVIAGRTALAYRAVNIVEQFAGSPNAVAAGLLAGFASVFGPVNAFTSTIGVVSIAIGAPGRAIEYAGELRLPGAMSQNFSGSDFVEDNVNLAPEQPTIVSNASGGGLTSSATYQWVIVWEGTTQSGNRVKSAPCIARGHTMGASDNRAVLTIPTLRVTAWTNLIASVYRTYIQNGQMTTVHAKVSNDLSPLYNSTSVDTITFTDTMSDATAAVGEPLYTDGLTSPPLGYRYPAPPFTSGCVAANRVFVIGYDGAIWFSFEKVENEQLSFNSSQRIAMPTSDPMIRILPLDTRIIIFCLESVWAFDLGNSLPDVNGNGVLPVPYVLPFSNGIDPNGCADIVNSGIVYASNTPGGPWLVTRGLANTYIGGPVEDDALVASYVDAIVDGNQRIHFLIRGSSDMDLVYDSVVDQWYTWNLPTNHAFRLGSMDGNLVASDLTTTWEQIPGLYTENSAGIVTTTALAPMAFAGVPGLQMVWVLQFLGTAFGRHTLTITVTYDDGTDITETFQFDSTGIAIPAGGAFRWDCDLANPECQAVSVQIVDSFPNGPNQGYALENIGAEVGIIPGARKVPIAQRIAG